MKIETLEITHISMLRYCEPMNTNTVYSSYYNNGIKISFYKNPEDMSKIKEWEYTLVITNVEYIYFFNNVEDAYEYAKNNFKDKNYRVVHNSENFILDESQIVANDPNMFYLSTTFQVYVKTKVNDDISSTACVNQNSNKHISLMNDQSFHKLHVHVGLPKLKENIMCSAILQKRKDLGFYNDTLLMQFIKNDKEVHPTHLVYLLDVSSDDIINHKNLKDETLVTCIENYIDDVNKREVLLTHISNRLSHPK